MTASVAATPPLWRASTCPHDCPSACALEVELTALNTIGRVRASADNSYTRGVICAKVSRYAERHHHPDRLTVPLIRQGAKGSGDFRQASWDEALDRVAEAFLSASAKFGPETVWPYYYAGTMGMLQRDGILRFRRQFGYSAMATTICSAISKAGWLAGVGALRGADPREILESDLVIFWGCNAAHTQIQTLNMALDARRQRGTKVVVIDPYRNATAAKADLHLAPRPGTDGALACAVMHVLLSEGLADRDYMARYTDCPERLAQHLSTRDPHWAAAITGLSAEQIIAFARLYGGTPRALIRLGLGLSRSRNGAATIHAVSCLPAVSGAWRHRGGGAALMNSSLFHLDRTLVDGLDLPERPARTLDMAKIGRVLTNDTEALEGGPPVTAMIVQSTNPAVIAPESALVQQGLTRDDLFLCVHEQFLTDTARMADVVLPATTFLEHDDIYPSYGQTFLQAGPRLVEPLAEARSNYDTLRALATRLGSDHPHWSLHAEAILEETLRTSGYGSYQDLKDKRWLDCVGDFEDQHFLNGFPHSDGKFHFAADWIATSGGCATADAQEPADPLSASAMPKLPDFYDVLDTSTAERPFRLVTAPARNFLNSTFGETASSRKREGEPTALIHPQTLDQLGLEDGQLMRLGNVRASIVVTAKSFDGLDRQTVIVETLWGNAAYREGKGINYLTSADRVPPVGGAGFHDTAVWIKRAYPDNA